MATQQQNTTKEHRQQTASKNDEYCQFSGVVLKPFDNEVFFPGFVLYENINSYCKFQVFLSL